MKKGKKIAEENTTKYWIRFVCYFTVTSTYGKFRWKLETVFNGNIDHIEILFMRVLFCIFSVLAIITGKLYIVTIFCDSRRDFG
jgi:hypothetical protein